MDGLGHEIGRTAKGVGMWVRTVGVSIESIFMVMGVIKAAETKKMRFLLHYIPRRALEVVETLIIDLSISIIG